VAVNTQICSWDLELLINLGTGTWPWVDLEYLETPPPPKQVKMMSVDVPGYTFWGLEYNSVIQIYNSNNNK